MNLLKTLLPLLTLVAAAPLAQQAVASTCSGTNGVTAAAVSKSCGSNPPASGFIRGGAGTGAFRVFADLRQGSSLTVVGTNQNGSNLNGTCAVRDTTRDLTEKNSGANTCIPDSIGEQFVGLFFSINN